MNVKNIVIENDFLKDEVERLEQELSEIKSLTMYEFADKYCTPEELEDAGHQLAKSLGVGV